MPIDLKKATAIAIDRAVTRYKHLDYPRTVQLRKDYTAYQTGEGLNEKMRRFKRRETEADFDQRKALTVHITKSVVSAMMGPERKLVNVKPVLDTISYDPENDKKAKDLRDITATFYGGRDIDHYQSTLIDPAEMDPNAFVVLAFDNFDFRYDKPTTYPFRIACDNVWDFQYFNGRLQYLWSQFTIQYVIDEGTPDPNTGKRKPVMKDGDRFVLYVDNHHVVLEQVKDTLTTNNIEGALMLADGTLVEVIGNNSVVFGKEEVPRYFLRTAKDTLYAVTFYEQKSGQVPAYRLGCKPDGITDGRTCVNMWDQAVPFLEKSIMQVSELDLTTALHVWPRLLGYGPKCEDCNGGLNVNGGECKTCGGPPGIKTTHTTSMDHLLLPWPGRNEDLKDLTNVMTYVDAPVELIQQMRDIVKDTYDSAIRAMYGSDIYVKNTVANTATEKNIEQQSIYDTLQPRASWWSESRITTTQVTAAYNDMADGLKVIHRYPRRLGFESASELIGMRKAAKEAEVDPATLIALDEDIEENILLDDPDQAKRASTWRRFNPFPGKSEGTITALISGGAVSKRSSLLWTEQGTIFGKAEKEFMGKPVGFYDLDSDKQDDTIERIINDMLGDSDQDPNMRLDPALGVEDPDMVDATADASGDTTVKDTSLNGAQVSSLVEVISLVATGVLTQSTADAMIKAAFPGIDPSLVSQMLSNVKVVSPDAIRAADEVRNPRSEAGTDQPQEEQPAADKEAA